MTPQELLNANGITLDSYEPGQHCATCPECSAKRTKSHQKTKCLGVKIEANERVVWHCNHCDWSGPPKGPKADRKIVPTHIYRDRDGVIRFGKVRNPPGAKIKCWFCHPDGKGGWAKKLGDADASILYRIDEVTDAIEAGREIAVVEGEKDCDNLWRLDIPATCNAHGASEVGKKPKWTAAHSEQLRGAEIVVFNDNDVPGYAHADATCKLSHGVAKRVRRLDLKDHWPEIQKGGDVSNWLAIGGEHTPERLRELIAGAPEITEPEKPEPPDEDAEIERLAKLSAFEYERNRAAAAKALGIRAGMLDKLVTFKRAELGLGDDNKQGRPLTYPEIEPWPKPVDGAALLDEIAAAIERFMILPPHGATIAALWPVHTHCLDIFMVTPRLQVSAPDSECGKTTLLYVLNSFVYRPQNAAAVTPALLFRLMDKFRPTLMLDEADALLPDNEDLRQILDIGHHRYGEVCRLVGDNHEPRAFRAYGAVAYGMIGELSGKLRTLDSRSIATRLKRKLDTETVEDFDIDSSPAELAPIARRIARFLKDNVQAIAAAKPNVPLSNRRRDNWMPLFKIAAVAGGEWPKRVLAAATAKEEAGRSRLEQLLSDIRDVFDRIGRDRISSAELVGKLCEITPGPWAEYGKSGKPLTQNKLAKLLKSLAVTPQVMRLDDGDLVRGYQRSQFDEAFERYLSPTEGGSKRNNVTNPDNTGASDLFRSVTDGAEVTVPNSQKPNNDGPCYVVTVEKGGNGSARVSRLSDAEIDELRAWTVAFDWQHRNQPDALAQALRERLCNRYDVRPNDLEAEAARVMDAVFRT
jgi:putative DNA primase/helicase